MGEFYHFRVVKFMCYQENCGTIIIIFILFVDFATENLELYE